MTISDSDKKAVTQAVNNGGSVNTNGMNSTRATEIRAEEARQRAAQQK